LTKPLKCISIDGDRPTNHEAIGEGKFKDQVTNKSKGLGGNDDRMYEIMVGAFFGTRHKSYVLCFKGPPMYDHCIEDEDGNFVFLLGRSLSFVGYR
jgi:hypothetical protein